jgi:hypothetical protein
MRIEVLMRMKMKVVAVQMQMIELIEINSIEMLAK